MRVQGAVHLHEMGYLVCVAQAAGRSGLRARAAQAQRRVVRRLGGALHILSECCYAAPLHVHAESVTCDASERIELHWQSVRTLETVLRKIVYWELAAASDEIAQQLHGGVRGSLWDGIICDGRCVRGCSKRAGNNLQRFRAVGHA
jgi:hypothetical protein